MISPTEVANPGKTKRDLVHKSVLLLAGIAILSLAAAGSSNDKPTPTSGFAVNAAWEQNFSGIANGPLPSDWNIDTGTGPNNDGWGNNEAQYYTNRPSNVSIQNGALTIEARQESYGSREYTSGRINTQGSFDFTYGKIEVTMKLPKGTGTWPAVWFWPSGAKYTPKNTGVSPHDADVYMLNGELDMMEAVGAEPGTITATAHTYGQVKNSPNGNQGSTLVPTDTEAYHVYGIEKTPNYISFTVDGKAYYTLYKPKDVTAKNWPFDQPYSLRINLAMGGTYGSEKKVEFPPYGIDNSSGPWILAIKQVAYYPLTDTSRE